MGGGQEDQEGILCLRCLVPLYYSSSFVCHALSSWLSLAPQLGVCWAGFLSWMSSLPAGPLGPPLPSRQAQSRLREGTVGKEPAEGPVNPLGK